MAVAVLMARRVAIRSMDRPRRRSVERLAGVVVGLSRGRWRAMGAGVLLHAADDEKRGDPRRWPRHYRRKANRFIRACKEVYY